MGHPIGDLLSESGNLCVSVVHELDRAVVEYLHPHGEFLVFALEGALKRLHTRVFEEELLDVVGVLYPGGKLIVIDLTATVSINVLKHLNGVVLDTHYRRGG